MKTVFWDYVLKSRFLFLIYTVNIYWIFLLKIGENYLRFFLLV